MATSASDDFASLFHSEHRRLYALALRVLGDRECAEDAVQEGFLRAWRGWTDFRAESSRATWIYGIVLRCALTVLRDDRRSNLLVLRDADAVDRAAASQSSPDMALDLDSALTHLSARPRAVFVLRDIEGFPINDVADLLQIAPGTVKAHLFRARKQLAAHLESYD